MEIRKTTYEDLAAIMEIVAGAQRLLHDRGIDQWQDGYPTEEVIVGDIRNGYSHILSDKGRVCATTAISFDGEPTYATIRNGRWPDDEPYAVVHRLAVRSDSLGNGYAEMMLGFAESESLSRGIRRIRVDTHADNTPMQRLLEKSGYVPCGDITLASGAPRRAFIKIL